MKFAKVFVVTATLMIASISPSVANEPVQTIDPPRVVNEQVQTIDPPRVVNEQVQTIDPPRVVNEQVQTIDPPRVVNEQVQTIDPPRVVNEQVQTIDPPRVVNEQVQTIYKILYPPTSTAISDTAFRQLMDDLRHSWPKDMEFLSQRVPQNYFTSAQAAKIVKEMTFGDKQEEAAVMLYPQIVDHGNWFVVEEAITFDSDLQRLRRDITNLYNLSR